MKRFLILCALVVSFSGCAAWNDAFGYSMKDVNIAKTSLTTADDIAYVYVSLPLCQTPKSKVLCSNVSTIVVISKARAAAYMAVTAAEAAQTQNAIGQAITAVNAFTQITSTLKTGN